MQGQIPYGYEPNYNTNYYDYQSNVRQQRSYGPYYQGRQDHYNQYRNQSQPYPRYNNYNRNKQQQRYQQGDNINTNQLSYQKVTKPLEKDAPEDKMDYKDPHWKDHIKVPPKDNRVKTEDVTHTKGSTFEHFNLKPQLLRGIYEYGFEKPSPVQEESIPNVLMRHSLLARAKNGTGKTAAYSIPVLQLVDENKPHIQAAILVPTRELSLQTSDFIKEISKYLKLNMMCSTGGMDLTDDIIRLRLPIHIIVATPGRLLDLARHGHARLGKCSMVVLDEADKLLSADFQGLIQEILKYIPSKIRENDETEIDRQLLLYSATFPQQVSDFCQKWMPQAKMINLMDELTLKGVTQFYAYIQEKQKVHAMFTLIRKLEINQCIIFCRSKNRVELLARKLTQLGFSCFYIHKDVPQLDRNRIFHEFRQGSTKCRYLVCTDLITRGIDIQSVNVVINFDFPKSSETYLHRIGRAGRFGHLALAVNFITDEDRKILYQIETELDTEISPIPNEVEKIDKKLYTQ